MAGYKRNTYLINPEFQIKFSLYVCGLVFVSSIIYPLTIYDLITSFITFMASKNPQVASQLEGKRSSLILILSLWQIGFTVLVFIICIFFSHKIAGPMYKLQKFLRAKKDGLESGKLFFRKGDYFQEVADDFNDVFEELEEQHNQDLVYLNEVNSYISNLGMVVPEDKKAVLNEITQKLNQIQNRFDNEQ
jgi:signal transduction histidine kinase